MRYSVWRLPSRCLRGYKNSANSQRGPWISQSLVRQSQRCAPQATRSWLLEERLNSIFEDGPQRTLAILQSDGHTVQPYMPPPGWSVVDFAVHPSGDISAILTTATGVRIVRLDPNGSIRSDQLFLDPSSPTDPFFNYAGGIKNDNALQPALMHDAARLAPLGESLAVVLRTGRNAIVAYRLDPDASGAYTACLADAGRTWKFDPRGRASRVAASTRSASSQNHLRIYVDVDSDAPATLADRCRQCPDAQLHVPCALRVFQRTNCSIDRCLAHACGDRRRPPPRKHCDRHAQPCRTAWSARYSSRLRVGGPGSLRGATRRKRLECVHCVGRARWHSRPVQCCRCRSRRRVVRYRSVAQWAISRAGYHRLHTEPIGREHIRSCATIVGAVKQWTARWPGTSATPGAPATTS